MNRDSVIYVAGGDTLLGAALLRRLRQGGFRRVLGDRDHAPELACQETVERFFAQRRPEYVIHAAGRAGGIGANQSHPADLCHDNLAITLHLLQAAQRFEVKRLLYLASACCYPRLAPQPLRVESLWTGPLEPTNQPYAAAKLTGIALCQAYRQQYGCDFLVGIPANLFGPGDDFDPDEGHVVAALMSRMYEAREAADRAVTVWGSGAPVREFLYVDDAADACIHVLQHIHDTSILNIAGGLSLSIAELAERVRGVVGLEADLIFDNSRPDGMPRKSLDASELLASGWQPRADFDQALQATYQWYLRHYQARLAHAG